jgi:hypothetical protein
MWLSQVEKSSANVEMLKDFLDWQAIDNAKGDQGNTLSNLFINGIVLASVSTEDWQGYLGYAYLVYGYTKTVKIVVLSDSYGSCSGCDQWQAIADNYDSKAIHQMCINLANDAHAFDSIEEAISWLREAGKDSSNHYEWHDGMGGKLADALSVKLEEIKAKGL